MLNYTTLKEKPETLLALTGLARREVEELLPTFTSMLADSEAQKPRAQKRKRAPGGGRKPKLTMPADKLVFILVYTKTYPLQVVQGAMFEMSQSCASEWISALLPVLAATLDKLGYLPEREGKRFATHERQHGEGRDLTIDGVERRRQRPQNPLKQAMHYSGKKKGHFDKNVIISNTQSKRVGFLSPTLPGSVHDKAIADHLSDLRYPPGTLLRSDLGFQGYAPQVAEHLQPQKSRRMASCGRARSGEIENWLGGGYALSIPSRVSSAVGSSKIQVAI